MTRSCATPHPRCMLPHMTATLTHKTTIAMSGNLHARVRAAAAREHRTTNGQLCHLIERGLDITDLQEEALDTIIELRAKFDTIP
jgi:hypothetical protein